jgi:hypothetical protein
MVRLSVVIQAVECAGCWQLEAAPGAPVVEFDFVSRQLGLAYVEAVRGATR